MQKSLLKDAKDPNKTQKLQKMEPQVDFCPQCGALLKIVAPKKAPLLACPKCAYNKPIEQNEVTKQNVHRGHPVEIAVIDKNKEATLRPLPTVIAICPKCGKNKSETWTIAVGGETANSTVTFFRCTTCGHTRRETG
jgi:DNA-directed RNA polymerase subunit M/transcription elongation factor TFIIS